MKTDFLEPAATELKEAVAFYEDQRSGLGVEFTTEVENTIARIQRDPESWEQIAPNLHRCRRAVVKCELSG